MSYRFKVKEAKSSSELQRVFEIRHLVFVEEQGVSKEEEYDNYETTSTHLIVEENEKALGTCRFRNTEKGIKLERFAVLEDYRGLGIGTLLVQGVLESIDTSQSIYLHAQIQVVNFYAKFGFVKKGDVFDEAGIKHYRMILA